MIEEETVLILGAGASKPYGFPLGYELRDKVLEIENVEYERVFAILDEHYDDYNDFHDFKFDLANSGHSSVDSFLEEREKWLKIGKIAIAYKLLSYESLDPLFPPNQPNDHWYEVLWQKLLASSWRQFKENKINIITFNYDRSLEQYLATVISNNFKIRKGTAFRNLPIIHVHGNLGSYEDYGKCEHEFIQKAANSIMIVHESYKSSKEFVKANEIIKYSKKTLFIGFGYHPQNMNKLSAIKSWKYSFPHTILGTHKGFRSGAWMGICDRYGFSAVARRNGGGTISEFLSDWL